MDDKKEDVTSITIVADHDAEQASTTILSLSTLNPERFNITNENVETDINSKMTGSVVVPDPPTVPMVSLDDNNAAIQAAVAAAIQATRNEMQAQLDATRQELLKAKNDLAQIHSTKKPSGVQRRQDIDNNDVTEDEISLHVPDRTKMSSSSTNTRSTRSTSLKGNDTERTKIREKRKSSTATLTKEVTKKRAGITTSEKLQANAHNKSSKDTLTLSTKKKTQETKKFDSVSSSTYDHSPPLAARISRSSLSRQRSNKLDTSTVHERSKFSSRKPPKRKKLEDYNDESDDVPNLKNDNEYHSPAAARTRSSSSTRQRKNKDTTTVRELIKLIKTPPKRKKSKDPNDESSDPNLEIGNGNDDNKEDNDDINSDSDAKVPAVTKRRSPRSSLSRQSNTKVQKGKLTSKKPPKRKNMNDHNDESDDGNDVDDDDDPNFVNDVDTDDNSEDDDDDINSDSDVKVPAVATRSRVVPGKKKLTKVKTTSRKKQRTKTNSLFRKSENKILIDHSNNISTYDDSLLLTDDRNKVFNAAKQDTNDIYWSKSFADLHTFRYIHGHCNIGLVIFHVPAAKERYKQLYLFVKTIRDEYNATHHHQQLNNNDEEDKVHNNNTNDTIQIEKPSSEKVVLNDERIADLLELDFNFDWNSDVHLSVDDSVVTKKKTNDTNQQGEVVTNKMKTKQKFVPSFDLLWEKRYTELCNFAKTHGNCDAPRPPPRNANNDTEEAAAYRIFFEWLKQVRYFFRRRIEQELMLLHPEYHSKQHSNAPSSIVVASTLTNERIVRLIKIGFHFNRYSPREELPIIRIPSEISNESESIANPVEDNIQRPTLTDNERVEGLKINDSRDVEMQTGDLHTADESPRERNEQRVYGHGLGGKKKERPILIIDPSWQENWEKMVQLLHEYKSTYGSVAELAGYKLDELNRTEMQIALIDVRYKDLRRWIETVRYYLKIYRNDTSEVQFFNAEKIETLLEISLSIVQDPPPERMHYKRPKKATVKETQKALRADGRKMTGQEIKDMEWEKNFQELKRFYIEHNTLEVPVCRRGKVDDQNRDLRLWMNYQRKHYENMMSRKWKSPQMTVQRVAKLMEIGFRFKKLKVWTFEERIEQYKKYLENNDGKHPSGLTGDGLGSFVDRLRKKYKKFVKGQSCNLDRGQIDIMKSIGFSFNEKVLRKPRNPPKPPLSWEESFASLIEYKEKHGDFNVPSNSRLSQWCRTQRSLYRKYLAGKPSNQIAEHATKLKNIGFKFMIRDPNYIPKKLRPATIPHHLSWDDSYQKLIEFKQINGHTRVSENSCTSQLCRWAYNQRVQYNQYCSGKKSPMTEEKIAKLNEIGFEFSLLNTGSLIKATRNKQLLSSSNVDVATTVSPGEDGANDDDDETESSDSDSSSSDDDDDEETVHDSDQVDDNADCSSSSEAEEEEQCPEYQQQHVQLGSISRHPQTHDNILIQQDEHREQEYKYL